MLLRSRVKKRIVRTIVIYIFFLHIQLMGFFSKARTWKHKNQHRFRHPGVFRCFVCTKLYCCVQFVRQLYNNNNIVYLMWVLLWCPTIGVVTDKRVKPIVIARFICTYMRVQRECVRRKWNEKKKIVHLEQVLFIHTGIIGRVRGKNGSPDRFQQSTAHRACVPQVYMVIPAQSADCQRENTAPRRGIWRAVLRIYDVLIY